jgi:pimeloyl-ACP methyl ester carboxylesterase
MNKTNAFRMLLLLGLMFVSYTLATAQPGIEGSWQGTLTVPGASLRVVFNIAKGPEGTFTATMGIPDQSAKAIQVDQVTLTETHLLLELKAIMGSFEGDIADQKSITGNWKQGGASFPLTLQRSETSASAPAPAPVLPELKKSSSSDPNDIKGNWLGALSFSGAELRLIVKITIDSSGKLITALDSPDQGATNIPVEETGFQNGHLSLAVKSIGGGLEGDLAEDKTMIQATWTQGGMSLPLELKRIDSIPQLNRPQEPKPPFPYDEREVTYENKGAGVTLAGTLTLPRTGGPFPVVLLITGSGAQNRNEELMGHKPFLVLADYLTRRGIAVLRVDDRGVGQSTGQFKTATSLDFLGDVLAGVAYLKTVKEIDPRHIGLIGHSEGGMIAPLAAVKSPDVAFIVLMAGPGIPGDQLLALQQALIEKAQGMNDEIISKNSKIQEQVLAVAKSSLDSAAAAAKIHQIIKDGIAQMTEEEKKQPAYAPEMVEVSVQQVLSPWFRYFMTYDPRPTLEKVKCPVLAINGEKDLQVPPKQNLSAIEKYLKKAGNKDFTVKELPGLNHLFQTATTGSPDEYVKIEETISPSALSTISDWILAHVMKGK